MFSKDDLLFIVNDASDVLKIEGQYAQKVMLILPAADYDSTRLFLEKMLSAAKLNLMQDTLIVQLLGQESVNIMQEIKKRAPEQVLIFGIQPDQLCLHIETKLYQPLFFQNTNFLFADRLTLLESDKNMKTKLWAAMQVVFKIQK
ncbi:MAG: hypothetical protein RIR11_4231 [Bacteroidota bacterium]|jgi:hypothetical protein